MEETEDVFFFYFFDSGGEVDIWRFFSRLPIRTIRNPIVKLFVVVFFFFYHWVALITLISLGNYRLRKKPMNECSVFHCVLWLHTNNFLGFSFFFLFLYFFVTAADRLLIICLYYSGDMHHSLSFNSLMIMCILAGRVLFRKTKSCTKMYKRKDKCSR